MKNIYAAFVKAQQAFSPALKASVNPHFKSKYVDLAGCVEAVMDALNANGIALVQQTHESDTGVIVETTFIHESGEMMSAGRLHFPASKNDAQAFMSALTYCRRGSLMAACGIAPEDNDGNDASKKRPDVAAILKGIANSGNRELLTTNFENAMQMLDESHHASIKNAANKRKAELTTKEKA